MRIDNISLESYIDDFYLSNGLPMVNVDFPNGEKSSFFYVDNGIQPFSVDFDEFDSLEELDEILRMRTIMPIREYE